MLDNVGILLVLIVRTVGLDDAIDSVNGTRYSISRNEFGQVAGRNRRSGGVFEHVADSATR